MCSHLELSSLHIGIPIQSIMCLLGDDKGPTYVGRTTRISTASMGVSESGHPPNSRIPILWHPERSAFSPLLLDMIIGSSLLRNVGCRKSSFAGLGGFRVLGSMGFDEL